MKAMKPQMRLHTEPRTVTLFWQRTEVTNLITDATLMPGVSVDELIQAIENGGGLEMDKAGPSGGNVHDSNENILATFKTPDWQDYYEEHSDIVIECQEDIV
jgi:hypothetical protein